MSGLSPGYVTYHPPGPIRLPNNKIKLNHPGSTRKQYRQLSAPHIMEDNSIGAEPFRTGGPSPWTEHLCGPGEAYCPGSAGVPLATSRITIALFFVRPQSTLAARTPQAPTAALEDPATATRSTPAAAASPAPAKVSGSRHSSSPLKPRH